MSRCRLCLEHPGAVDGECSGCWLCRKLLTELSELSGEPRAWALDRLRVLISSIQEEKAKASKTKSGEGEPAQPPPEAAKDPIPEVKEEKESPAPAPGVKDQEKEEKPPTEIEEKDKKESGRTKEPASKKREGIKERVQRIA